MEMSTLTRALTSDKNAIANALAFKPPVFRGEYQGLGENVDLAHDLDHSSTYGGCLLPPIETAFSKAAKECDPFSSSGLAPLSGTIGQLVRTNRLEPKAAAGGVFELYIGLGMSASYARSIQSSLQQMEAFR
ncbi:hypothetical protein [Neorhizobium sp. S3-V5DH]|uniref:hypothetical protein n=1 Tax=Neorhizobium sp. S3-V5DH TaxID=2485166 RepID=UPI001042F00E|nr:hypothetical protein [Neorhizobium sp. S3-V5DH]TCV69364.1 hypothetical protein EDE09_11082 [Neorhizobium sp. S3-V5DH]